MTPHTHTANHASDTDLRHRIKTAGLSVTPTRIEILKLLGTAHRLLTIDQILSHLGKEQVFTTIYRCLLKLEEVKLVQSVDLGDGTRRYEAFGDVDHHHHHVMCRSCSKIEAVHLCGISALESKVKKLGYSDIQHEIQIFAICKYCQKKN